jgi:hypothetical protein
MKHVLAFKFVDQHDDRWTHNVDVNLGDVIFAIVPSGQIPMGWTEIIPPPSHPYELNPTEGLHTVEKAIRLAVGQVWVPKINCRTYAPKVIIGIDQHDVEVEYRQAGDHVWGGVNSFIEWILDTNAELREITLPEPVLTVRDRITAARLNIAL